MTKEARQSEILRRLTQQGLVLYDKLGLALGVSEDTIRRDINELAEKGLLSRTKGGAKPKAIVPVTYLEREVFSAAGKRVVAQKAVQLIKEGQVVVFDGGTTPFLVATYLPSNISLTIITHSYPVANIAFGMPNVELIFAGGRASKKSKISTGIDVLQKFNTLHADLSILGVHSIHPEIGISDPVYEEAEVKTRISKMADQVIAVCTAEKLNTSSMVNICSLDALDIMITDLSPDDKMLHSYQQAGLNVL